MVPGEKDICKITKKLAIPKIIKSQHRNKPVQPSRIPTNLFAHNIDFLLLKRNLDHFFVFSFLVAAHWGQVVIRFDILTVFVQ